MKRLYALPLLLIATASLASSPDWANNDKARADASAISISDASARASASNFTSVSSHQAQGQLQGQLAYGGNAVSEGSTASATTGASNSASSVGNVTSQSGASTSQVGNVSATSAPSTSSVGNVSTGAATATLGSVVESGAVQSSTNVTTNYREAAQGVAIVLTTACGTAASGSGRSFTFGAAQGQDAFCKNLALAKVYFDLGDNDKGLAFIEAAADLVKVDNVFDQITTVLTLGILK